MAEQYDKLDKTHRAFIEAQHLYFVGTAGAEGFVNVSPKGMDSFRILDDSTIAWLNLTGSGNETAAHVLENGRMTVMFCSFDKQPMIMRLYGQALAVHPRDARWAELAALFPKNIGAQFGNFSFKSLSFSNTYSVSSVWVSPSEINLETKSHLRILRQVPSSAL